MIDKLMQIEENTVCAQCGYDVTAKSIMHKIGDKLYCASCAEGIRNKEKKHDIE